MPGTIQVSVAMGKTEYQSIGKGDFSFPVTSLRENLIVMLHDVEGNEIFRTEFRTISVVEKGFFDDFFPLKDGGYVHMKLQFSLSQEERMRIRDMRESALKRKRGEQLKTGLKGSVSDQSGLSGTPSLQVSEEFSEHSFERDVSQLIEVNKEILNIQSPLDGIHEKQISAEVGLDPQSGCSRFLVSGNVTEHSNSIPAELEGDRIGTTKKKILLEGSSSSNVRKMISAFESSPSQGPVLHFGSRTKSLVHKVDIEGSLRRASSQESDINILEVPQTIAKSFSAGMLSDINSQQDPNIFRSAFMKKQEEKEHFSPATRWESMGKGKLALEFKNDQKLKNLGSGEQKAVKETIRTKKAVSSARFSEDVSEREGPVSFAVKKVPSIMYLKSDFKAMKESLNLEVIPKGGKILHTHTTNETSDEMPSSHNGEKLEAGAKHNPADGRNPFICTTDDGNGAFKQSVSDYLQLSHEVKNEAMHTKENKNEAHALEEAQLSRRMLDASASIDQPCSLSTHQQESSLSAVTKESDGECCRSYSDEEIVSGISNRAEELLTYSNNEGYPFGSLDIWTPRHLCITTGSKQLRDQLECCNNYRGTHPIEKDLSMMGADGKQKTHDDTSVEVYKNEKISCTSGKSGHENSVSNSKTVGGLIELGVRIAIIIVACGTLLLNTRQRKPRLS